MKTEMDTGKQRANRNQTGKQNGNCIEELRVLLGVTALTIPTQAPEAKLPLLASISTLRHDFFNNGEEATARDTNTAHQTPVRQSKRRRTGQAPTKPSYVPQYPNPLIRKKTQW